MSQKWVSTSPYWEKPIEGSPGQISIVPLRQRWGHAPEEIEEMCTRLGVRLVTRAEYTDAITVGTLTHSQGFPIGVADRWGRGRCQTRHGFFINPNNGNRLTETVAKNDNWRLRMSNRTYRRPCWRFAVTPLA